MKIKVKFPNQFNIKRVLIITAIVLVIGGIAIYQANSFFNKNTLVFKSPVVVKVQSPVELLARVTENQIIQVVSGEELPLTENEIYLCKKFGSQCKTALEVQRRENPKGDCDAFYVNKNKSLDFGLMQINSVHLNSDVTIAQLVDCKKNIDIAYEIYKRDGWSAWTTYQYVIK